MNMYRIEGTAVLTFYVRAESAEAALEALESALLGDEMPEVSSARFDSPELPDISISPAMTVLTVDGEAEEVEEDL
jgi:hypothetical protein